MKKIKNLLCLLAFSLLAVVPWSFALQLSDLHLPMSRDEADTSLSKDYESVILMDGSVRRTWKLDNRTVFVDFTTTTNEGVLIAIIYDKPVSLKEGKADAEKLAAGNLDKSLEWAPPKSSKARTQVLEVFGLEHPMRMMLSDESMLFYETDKSKKKIVRVSLFLRMPSTNRWILQEVPPDAGRTAMGNHLSSASVKKMYADEERRRAIPLKSVAVADAGDRQSEQNDTAEEPPSKVPQRESSDKPKKEVAVTQPTASESPAPSSGSPTVKEPEKVKIKLDRGRQKSRKMTFLVAPPDWLKKVGIENPTWWHYIGIAAVALLLVIMILRSISRASAAAARRRNFSAVLDQGGQLSAKQKKR